MSSQGSESQDQDLCVLLEAASRGDDAAWRELVARYGRRVFALARSRCKDSDVAEEITQSVFTTIAAKLAGGEYAERGRFESWLFRVAMNRVRDHARKQKRRMGSLDQVGEARTPAAEGGPLAVEGSQVERLREAVSMLSDADREVVELRHHGGLGFKEMAELLGEPLGTILARHHRALRKLREFLEAGAESPRGAMT